MVFASCPALSRPRGVASAPGQPRSGFRGVDPVAGIDLFPFMRLSVIFLPTERTPQASSLRADRLRSLTLTRSELRRVRSARSEMVWLPLRGATSSRRREAALCPARAFPFLVLTSRLTWLHESRLAVSASLWYPRQRWCVTRCCHTRIQQGSEYNGD